MKPFEQTLHGRTEALLVAALGGEALAEGRAEGARLQLAEAVGVATALGLESAA